MTDTATLKDSERWKWWPLIVNEGACVTVRRSDAIRFGGFDEHESYRGYLCGPYDLGWRLINAGWPEIWHDESVALWHFAHPDPIGANCHKASLKQLMEKSYPHINGHALTAVDAFSTGRFQPLKENSKIWALRMQDRKIGSELEFGYSNLTGQNGYSRGKLRTLWLVLYSEIIGQYIKDRVWSPLRHVIWIMIGKKAERKLRAFYLRKKMAYRVKHSIPDEIPLKRAILVRFMGEKSLRKLRNLYLDNKLRNLYLVNIGLHKVNHSVPAEHPILLTSFHGYDIIKYKMKFYGAPRGNKIDLLTKEGLNYPDLLVSDEFNNLCKMVNNK